MKEPIIENGFAKVEDGTWLMGAAQPAAVLGESRFRSLKGWIVPDRSRLHLMELKGTACCSLADRPFLTLINCAVPVSVLSSKILVAPQEARSKGTVVRIIPFSFRNALCVTECTSEWVVTATKSRTTRLVIKEGDILAVRHESVVAWTTRNPNGFCPRIGLRDIFIPRKNVRNMMLHFYGPGIVWLEGSNAS